MPLIPFDAKEWQRHLVQDEKDVQASSASLSLRAGENTDWWRTAKGSDPESAANRHNGPLYVFEVQDDVRYWTAGVWIAVKHAERFQQGALFIGVGNYINDDQAPWLKAGVEIEHDEQNIGSVVTVPFSDWTLFVTPKAISETQGQWLFVEAKRTGADIILSYGYGEPSAGDAEARPSNVSLMREIKGFTERIAQTGAVWNVGVMTCGPKSRSTVSTFHHFSFRKDDDH